MARYQYSLQTRTKWMAQSGDALLVLTNVSGSARKINIHSIDVQNNTRFGYASTANSNTPSPARIRTAFVSSLNGGRLLTPVDANSSATFPGTIQIETATAYTPTYVQLGASLTMAGATAGSTTFTPGSAPTGPAWTTNEHRDGNRYFIVDTGGNAGTYRIVSNTATALTLDRPFSTTVSTTGYVAVIKELVHDVFQKQLSTSTTGTIAVTNFGRYFLKNLPTGMVVQHSPHSNLQQITVRANEKLAVFADFINSPVPVIVSASFIVEGTPNRTYMVDYFAVLNAENEAILSIDNNSGSGQVIRLVDLSVSEVGQVDTPYLQVVPVGSISAFAYNDSDKSLNSSIVKHNSSYPTVSTNIMRAFTNVPILPSGVPASYIAEGSAAAIPKGFSYLNTKDFIGPQYMVLFPEAAGHKIENSTFWGTSLPGTLGIQQSQQFSTIKGRHAPIVIREGEGIAIVSGAETAAGAAVNTVGISGWQDLEFNIVFSIENYITPNLVLTGLQDNSEVRIYDNSSGVELAGSDNVTGGTFSYGYDFTVVTAVDIVVMHLNYKYIRLTNQALGTGGLTVPIQQVSDLTYSNP